MPLVSKRYAEALIELSEEKGFKDEFFNNLKVIVDIFKSNTEFKSFLLNRKVHPQSKKRILKNIFENRVEKELLNFLMLLVDKDRLDILEEIYDEFQKMWDERKNTLILKIISATPLEVEQISRIKEKYMRFYNKNAARATLEIDKSLIGGVKIQIGDRIIDDSVKSKLLGLKKMMLQRL